MRIINKFLERHFSIKFVKVHKAKFIISKNNRENNLIVEFLGPPGVGKSYLCDFFIKKYANHFNREVLTRKDLQTQKVDNIVLSEEYNQLLNLRISEISATSKSGLEKYKSINHEYQLLKNDIICNVFFSNKLIVTDEQLFKTFGRHILKIIDYQGLESLLKNRVFILCYASPERITNNQMKKMKNSSSLSKEQLKFRMDEDLELIETIIKYGGKVIKINTEDSLDSNSKYIYTFIQESLNT